jgi:UDPglucose 6-dehydrogenase/GDP-mannose 6-dehydrogenase
MTTLNISIIGCGYVGLVTGACLADLGHHVCCLDVDSNKVNQVTSGTAPFFEEGLDEIIQRNIGQRLTASSNLTFYLNQADLILVCVGTPFDGKKIDLTYVLAAAEMLGEMLKQRDGYAVIAIKSTVIPGTTTNIFKQTLEKVSGKKAGVDFGLGMNPEFLAEGTAVKDFMHPDRIVIGGIDARSTSMLRSLYQHFDPSLIMDTNPTTAEMIKYASNSFMATLISFANEIASFCEIVDNVDVTDVLNGVNRMQHLNYEDDTGSRFPVSATKYLWAGCGFGGSCFPKDLKAITAFAKSNGKSANLLSAVIEVNENQPNQMINLLTKHRSLDSISKLSILGTAFKPGTDDVRESPALKLVHRLAEMNVNICCHDPMANDNAKIALKNMNTNLNSVTFTNNLNVALDSTDAVMLITSWPEYLEVPNKLKQLNNNTLLIDGRRFLSPSSYQPYAGIGH